MRLIRYMENNTKIGQKVLRTDRISFNPNKFGTVKYRIAKIGKRIFFLVLFKEIIKRS